MSDEPDYSGYVYDSLVYDYAALLARHNVLVLELEKTTQQLQSLQEMQDTDEWGPYALRNGKLHVQLLIESRARKDAEARHNALLEALEWERECKVMEQVAHDLYDRAIYDEDNANNNEALQESIKITTRAGSSFDESIQTHKAACAEVDRLLGEG